MTQSEKCPTFTRKSGNMDKELKETLSKVADYNKLEKEKVNKAGNVAFGLAFAVCAAMIVIQLLMVGELAIVAGETHKKYKGAMNRFRYSCT